MQLHSARLCFNCEDIHDQPVCPACGSDSFAYISRWIPASERPARVREPPPQETAEAYRQLLDTTRQTSGAKRWMTGGMVGLAAITMAGWAWRRKAAARGEAISSAIDPPDATTEIDEGRQSGKSDQTCARRIDDGER